jgi:hypothetical protein
LDSDIGRPLQRKALSAQGKTKELTKCSNAANIGHLRGAPTSLFREGQAGAFTAYRQSLRFFAAFSAIKLRREDIEHFEPVLIAWLEGAIVS